MTINFHRRIRNLPLSLRILFIATFFIAMYYWNYNSDMTEYTDQKEAYMRLQKYLGDLLTQEKGTGCLMPTIDPFSPELARSDNNIPVADCGGIEDWVECYISECYVRKSVLDRMWNVECRYRDIIYVDDDHFSYGELVRVKGGHKYTLNSSDYVKVSCTGNEKGSLGVALLHWRGRKAGFRPLKQTVKPPANALNVLILIVDSTSRNNFIRIMPTSYKALKDELGAVVMNAYNIVGDATHASLWPILTGHNDLEVPDSRILPNNSNRVDPNLFLFAVLKKYGYRTAYFEDEAFSNTFNYRFNGFERAPADHYARSLFLEESLDRGLMWWLTKSQYCFGSELIFSFLVKHTEEFFKTSGKKFCVMFSVKQSYDDENTLAWVDDELASFLKKFQSDGYLDNTLLFVMSDHGPRFTHTRATYLGKIEERLPFVSIVLPKRLKMQRPKAYHNLVGNSKVLTTPYDIHTTILDALGLKHHRNKHKVPGADLERGISLLEPIPVSRSCAEAGVTPYWCACARWGNVSNTEVIYSRVAWELAHYINKITEQKRELCVERNMVSIGWVHRKLDNIKGLGFKTESQVFDQRQEYYQAQIIMNPGKAIFEASMSYNVKEDSFRISDEDVSRVNRYGDEPKCVIRTHPHLAPYCYCKIISTLQHLF